MKYYTERADGLPQDKPYETKYIKCGLEPCQWCYEKKKLLSNEG